MYIMRITEREQLLIIHVSIFILGQTLRFVDERIVS